MVYPGASNLKKRYPMKPKVISQLQLIGGLEPWNFMMFHSVGNVIIPTDFHSISFFRGQGIPPYKLTVILMDHSYLGSFSLRRLLVSMGLSTFTSSEFIFCRVSGRLESPFARLGFQPSPVMVASNLGWP